MTIPIPPYSFPTPRINRIVPFSYQDGETYLTILERMREYLNAIIEDVNTGFLKNDAFFASQLDKLITDVNTSIANHDTAIDTELANHTASVNQTVADLNARADQWLATQISNNDEITNTIINDAASTTRISVNDIIRSMTLTEVVTNANGSDGPNLTLGSVANRRGSVIADDVAVSVILNPGAGAGQNNIIGGDGAATVGTATPNTTVAGTNASVSVVGGYDNVAGSLSSKIISDHSYTEVGGDGHNAIYGGANNIARTAASYAGIFAGYLSEVAGAYAFVTGYRNKGRAQSVSVTGNDNDVSGTGSTADGSYNVVSGAYSAAVGNRNVVTGGYGRADGQYAKTRDAYQQAFAPGQFTKAGDAQTSVYIIKRVTTTDALAPLGIGGGSVGPLIDVDVSVAFSALVIARHEGGSDTAAWKVEGVLRRGASGAPVVIGTPAITSMGSDTGTTGWAVSSVTGGSTGGLNLNVKGDVTRPVRWVARVTTVEVGAATV